MENYEQQSKQIAGENGDAVVFLTNVPIFAQGQTKRFLD